MSKDKIKNSLLYQQLELGRHLNILFGRVFKCLHIRNAAKDYFNQARQVKQRQLEILKSNWQAGNVK